MAIEEFSGRERTVKLDRRLLEGYHKAVGAAAEIVGTNVALNLDMLLNIPELFVIDEEDVDPDVAWSLVEEAAKKAMKALVEMRAAEGERLKQDVLHRLAQVEKIVEVVTARAPEVVKEYRLRLTERINELLGPGSADEQRVAQEVAIFADKSNIDEELTRARSHIAQFREVCSNGGSIGRKLDFLLQELIREVNTIGSKAQDAEVASCVVEAKAELEKIREQVQNVQ